MRLPPIKHDQWSDEIREILASFSVPFSQYGLNGDESEKDRLSPILSTVLQSPGLARAYFPLANYLLRESSLQPRHTRLLILRVARLWHYEVEWSQHAMMAVRDNLLTKEDVDRVESGMISEQWTALEKLLLTAVDEVHAHSNISDSVWQGLAEYLDQQQLVDLTFTIGGYILAGLYMNVFNIPNPFKT